MTVLSRRLNEPVHLYAPGSPERSRLRSALSDMESAAPHTVQLHIGGKAGDGHGDAISVRAPHRHTLELAQARIATAADVRRAVDAALTAHHDWSSAPLGDPRLGVPPRRRPPERPVPRPPQRGDHPRSEQERPSGGDRCCMRAHRLLALERPLRRAAPGDAAGVVSWAVEPHGAPGARGLRAGDHPVQLHIDRGQPARRASDHGQHRGLEAGDHRSCSRRR